MTQELSRIYLEITSVLETASKVNFGPHNSHFQFFENLNCQFPSQTHFLNHKFEDPSCRICSYGPHGPFGFSVKFHADIEQRYQKKNFGEKSLFEITGEMNEFIGGIF